jgi:dienelactone hydrolase
MCHEDSPVGPSATGVVEHQETTASGIPLFVYAPEQGGGNRVPVIIATDIYGASPFYRYLGQLLAQAGHRAVVPDLFFRAGSLRDSSREAAFERRRRLDDRQALLDLGEAIDASRSPQQPYAVLGFCLGGTLALLTAAEHPDQATVTFYAFPRAVPQPTAPLAAPIEVAERIGGPVLAFWGREDYMDGDDVELLSQRLAAAPASTHVQVYEGVGHGFLSGLTEESAQTSAALDAWRQTIAFLREPPSTLPG